MIKLYTIGMIEKNSKNDPTVKAHTHLKNGSLHTISNGVTAYPVPGTSGNPQTKDLRIALNNSESDERNTEYVIPKDAFVNSFLLRAWDTQELVFNEFHVDYADSQSYSSINVGYKLIANAHGNFETINDTSTYGLYFEITKKIQFAGNGFVARIVCS